MSEENPLDTYSPFNEEEEKRPRTSGSGVAAVASQDEEDDEELRLLERRVNILAAQLRESENEVERARLTGSLDLPPNWPKFYPLIHFDIEEVAQPLRKFVMDAMFAWCVMVIAFSLNLIGCLALLRAGNVTESPGSKVALAALYLFLLVPLALDLSALSVYRVLKTDSPSSLSYMKLFLFLGITTFYQAFLVLGLESSGTCGLITMINLLFSSYWFIGNLSALITWCFALSSWLHYKLLMALWDYYKGTEQGENLEQDVKKTLAVMVVDALKK